MAVTEGVERKKHPDKALSDAKIRKVVEAGRYADGNGLYLVVDESGAKRWMVRTMIKGRRRDLGLGGLSYVSLAEARERAIEIRKSARNGGDPLADKREKKKAAERESQMPTFETAAREWHAKHTTSFRNNKHRAQWLRTLEDYAFPVFGNKRVDTVNSGDVLNALTPIWTAKPETAQRVKQRMKTVFDYAKAKGFRTDDNPTEGITKVLPRNRRKHKHHAALPYAQVPVFITELRSANAAQAVKLAFEFLILAAGRTSEVLKAKWNEIDFAGKVWTVPADRMKAKVDHRVPLSSRGIEILKAAKEISNGGDYIFPSAHPTKHLSDMAFNMCLRRMEQTGFTPHGFRSSFRDWAEEKTDHTQRTIETCLAHVVENKTEAAYLRTQLFEKRKELMAQWARFATAAPAKKVVPIHPRSRKVAS